MDFEVAVVAVGFAGEQRLKLAPRGLRLQLLEHLLRLGDDRLILLGLAELDHADLVLQVALDPADGVELILERSALLHHALRARRVVPERGVFGERIELGEPGLRLVEVKDASSAVRPTA